MAGKFHVPFAGDRYLMEFKYISNREAKNRKIVIEDFEPNPKDLAQLVAYDQDQRVLYPEQNIQSFLIYCFGNRGFRVFPMAERDRSVRHEFPLIDFD